MPYSRRRNDPFINSAADGGPCSALASWHAVFRGAPFGRLLQAIRQAQSCEAKANWHVRVDYVITVRSATCLNSDNYL